MLYLSIKLTFVQMYNLGIHLGHSFHVSKFLSFWIYGGWRSSLFIINLVKTRILLKNIIDVIQSATLFLRPIWFVNLNQRVGPYITRYAVLSGEPYVSYYWVNGTLTNYIAIFGWYMALYKLLISSKYKLRHRDKYKLLSYFGFLSHRRRYPALGFVTSTLVSWRAVNEFWSMSIPCAAVVDSNVLSWNISLPIPGNDDSLLCLNYYCYILTRNIIFSKGWNVVKFLGIIKKSKIDQQITISQHKKKILLVYFYRRKHQLNMRKNLLNDYFKEIKPLENLRWRFDNVMFDMTIFNTEYNAFKNDRFFNFFGISFNEAFESGRGNYWGLYINWGFCFISRTD